VCARENDKEVGAGATPTGASYLLIFPSCNGLTDFIERYALSLSGTAFAAFLKPVFSHFDANMRRDGIMLFMVLELIPRSLHPNPFIGEQIALFLPSANLQASTIRISKRAYGFLSVNKYLISAELNKKMSSH
jgi:hypothetical protein